MSEEKRFFLDLSGICINEVKVLNGEDFSKSIQIDLSKVTLPEPKKPLEIPKHLDKVEVDKFLDNLVEKFQPKEVKETVKPVFTRPVIVRGSVNEYSSSSIKASISELQYDECSII
jgi:hypothetical protein